MLCSWVTATHFRATEFDSLVLLLSLMINVGVLLQFLEMRLGFNSYIVVVRTTLHAYSCRSGMEANDCGFWVLQNIVCDFGLFQHWTGFENSFSPFAVHIHSYRESILLWGNRHLLVWITNSQGNDSLLFRFLKGLTSSTFLEWQVS